MSECNDCGADTSKRGWSQVPGKGELCNPCHDTWLKNRQSGPLPGEQPGSPARSDDAQDVPSA